MSRVLDYMITIADKSFELMRDKLKHLLEDIQTVRLECETKIQLCEQGTDNNHRSSSSPQVAQSLQQDIKNV